MSRATVLCKMDIEGGRWLVTLLAVGLASGCLGASAPRPVEGAPDGSVAPAVPLEPAGAAPPREAETSPPEPSPAPALPAVVVADIGPGVNPYHLEFRRPAWTQPPSLRIPGLPGDLAPLRLTFGDDYEASRAADEATWKGYEDERLYWVPGTNLLLYTMRPWEFRPDGEARTIHGTASAAAVNAVCPECYILIFQDSQSIDGEPVRRIAAQMPWVDLVVSTNLPGPYDPTSTAHADATRALWDAGRLYVSFAGNTPVSGLGGVPFAVPFHEVDYPPWVVMVGGVHSACSATEASAGKPTEFVGDFTQVLAATETVEGTRALSGTSFATPQVAGAFGRALLAVRQAVPQGSAEGSLWRTDARPESALDDGVLTQAELRSAMASAARYFETTVFTPGCGSAFGLPVDPPTALPPSPTPWIETGWGYVHGPEADLAAAILLGEAAAPGKPGAAILWMDAFMAARAAMFPW